MTLRARAHGVAFGSSPSGARRRAELVHRVPLRKPIAYILAVALAHRRQARKHHHARAQAGRGAASGDGRRMLLARVVVVGEHREALCAGCCVYVGRPPP